MTRVCPRRQDTAGLVARLLDHHRFACGYEDLGRDATLIARELDATDRAPVEALETARALFFRNKGAYLVGRAWRRGGGSHPVVIALANPRGRVAADAVLLTEDEASIVFSFTRSYFFVDTDRPRELVAFLRSLMPRKPVSELYDAIGHNKHGKTELYRALLAHIQASDDHFEIAAGQRGMVMAVFTLPSYDLVFKMIRDRFPPPKTATRREVMKKYELVFRHDRAGRLVDAREFEHLEFEKRRFSEALLEELRTETAGSVEIGDDTVVLHHLYTERRLRPLDLYLRESTPAEGRVAILDYGEAIRDLARSNIFPGDMLLKNFGVTRHGRIVFYDYDELAVLTDCRFREVPRARYDDEEMSGEPWFFVGENDVFPEEFLPFLGLQGEPREAFLARHSDLLGTASGPRCRRSTARAACPTSSRTRRRGGSRLAGGSVPVRLTSAGPRLAPLGRPSRPRPFARGRPSSSRDPRASRSSSSGSRVASTPTQPRGRSSPCASNRKREGTDRARRPYFARSKAQLRVSVVIARVMPT